MGQKNSEGDKTKKINESSNSKHLKVWYSNADALTTDKLNELEVPNRLRLSGHSMYC